MSMVMVVVMVMTAMVMTAIMAWRLASGVYSVG